MTSGTAGYGAASPRVPGDVAVYAVGDIHGRLDLLREIVSTIEADAHRGTRPRRRLIFMGDYVSRGPDSKGVIAYLLGLHLPGFQTVFLKGNHEDCLLRFMAGNLPVGAHWLSKGGVQTLNSYGVEANGGADWNTTSLDALRARLARAVPEAHKTFLAGLSRSHTEGDYYFVHAGIRPGIALGAQRERDQLWIRRRFHRSGDDHGAVIVHGHEIVPRVVFRRNRIGIDTGASHTGRLSCLVLEDDGRRVLQTGGGR